MSLTDREILDLNELCNSIIDNNLSRSEMERLSNWISESEEARQFYIRAMDQSASLGQYSSEMLVEAPDRATPSKRFLLKGMGMLIAVAASIAVAATISVKVPGQQESAEFVAKITGVSGSEWSNKSTPFKLGAFLSRGEQLELNKGIAEVTFDSGAVLVVTAPAKFDINSAWDATLHRGAIEVIVPTQAIGFRISNPAVELVDLGTQFSIVADGQGTADVFVIQGEVEALPQNSEGNEAILLRANESRRFGISGVSDLNANRIEAQSTSSSISFERISKSINYAHWSFDEKTGSVLNATTFGLQPMSSYELTLKKRPSATPHVDGFRNNGIRFDGRVLGKADFPGLSSDDARTVAFWTKVPRDATLSDSYSMIAWRADSNKLGLRPVHIGWNRNPDEGPLGAVRTDFSGGHAIGTTSLRDGLWHFVTIVFVPGTDPDTPVQVKQYVDSKLESNKVTPGPKLSIAAKGIVNEDSSLTDTLWLGCRLGSTGPRKSRFRGDIDELVIADRSLEPAEISQLMDGQELAPPNL